MSGYLEAYPFLGKVASVTGAGSGIGRATAQALYARGATIALADINAAGLAETEKLLKGMSARKGQRVATRMVDVTKETEVTDWTDAIVSEYGRLDYAANVAGGPETPGPLLTKTTEQFDFATNLNFRGVFNCMVAQLNRMSAGSSMVNVSSGAGLQAPPNLSIYSAAKGAVNTITGGAARESGPNGTRINAVSPGAVLTPASMRPENEKFIKASMDVTPLRRAAQPIEIAKAIAFLLSEEASYISGVILRVDGGLLSLSI